MQHFVYVCPISQGPNLPGLNSPHQGPNLPQQQKVWGPIRLEPPPVDPESGICDSEKRITGNQKEEWEGYEEDIPLFPFPSCSKIPPMFSYHSSLLPTIPDTLNWYTDTWFQSSQNLLCNIKLFNKNCPAKNSYFATKTLIYGIFVANVEKNTTYAFRG